MATQIYVNLPVKNLEKSKEFFQYCCACPAKAGTTWTNWYSKPWPQAAPPLWWRSTMALCTNGLDGHLWELISMAPAAVQVGPQDV